MNEERYKYFIDICEEKNITRAAEKNYISQPAMSKYVNSLESELNTKLFDRTTSSVKLTDTGNIYLEYARDMYSRYEKMKKDILENEKSNPKITFGISLNLSKYFLNNAVNIALGINPKFRFNIVEDTSLNMEKLLKLKKVDTAFLSTDNIDDDNIDFTVVKKRLYLSCLRKK